MKLSPKHKAFCDEYMINGMNVVQAYKSVYNCSDKSAQSNATRLMENDGIKEYIHQEQEKTAKKLEITKESLIKDLVKIKDDNIDDAPPFTIKAIEVINKMLGYNATEKTELTIREQPLLSDEEE